MENRKNEATSLHAEKPLTPFPWWQYRHLRTIGAVFPLLLLLVFGCPAFAAEENPAAPAQASATTAITPAIGERLLRANGYLENNRLDDALSVVDELARVRKLTPVDRAQIHRFRGYILVAKSKVDDASQEFEAALAENALDAAAREGMMYSLAQIYTQAGKYDRARQLIDGWFETASDPKPEAYFLKAMILVQQENFKEALAPVQTAVANSPQPRESWLQLLAAVQFQLQDYPGVADTLRRLIAVAPDTKRYWVQLATIENSLGQEDNALATLGIAHVNSLLSDDREYRQRARMCFVRDLPECCARTLEDGMASGHVKPDAEAWQLLANCRIAAREIDKAIEPLAKAGELSEDGKGFLMLGQIQLQKDRFDAARDALQKARTKAKPDQRPSIELLIGIADLGADRFDDAEQAFHAAQSDDKTRAAADSYLKHLEQRRALREMQAATLADDRARDATHNPGGSPVAGSAATSDNSSM
jgi:tetratricopeptide (TPR) repeat protein